MTVDRQRSTVVGVFRDPDDARDAISALKDAGFHGDDIGLLMRDRSQAQNMAEETGTKAGEGAATGAITGGILGGLAGWLVGIGALAIPGVGPFIAAGAFGSALTGAAIGAGVGAIAGALIGMGIPEEEAKWYEGEVKGGGTLVTVKADGRYDEAQSILRQHGAYDIEMRDSASMGARGTASTMPTTGTMGTGRWEDMMPQYRSSWQTRYGSQGGRFEDYEPAYRYGYEMHQDPRYSTRDWRDVEPELRRDWETRHHDMPWDRFRFAVQDAWEGMTGGRRTDVGTGDRVELREEQLQARKETVKTGEVTVGKDVVSEQRTMDVPVTREEVFVERRPVDRPASDRDFSSERDEVRVPVNEERVDVQKTARVYEEVEVGKRPVMETQRVSDTVRREVADVDTEGKARVGGMGQTDMGQTGMTDTGTWDDYAPTYRQSFEQRYSGQGLRWQDYEPAYRYGYEYSGDPKFQGRRFDEVEPELRGNYEDWSRKNNYRYEPGAWDRFKESVREAFEGARARTRR